MAEAIPPRLRAVLLPLGLGAALLLGLECLVASGHAPMSIARPTAVAQLIGEEYAMLLQQIVPTVVVAGWGYVLSLLFALGLGFASYAWRRLELSVLTAGAILSSIPIIAIAPILSVWLGLSLPTRVLITCIICVFPLLVAIIQGLKASTHSERELFTVLAASPWQRFRLLALPSALPFVFVGMKVSAPLAVLGALVAEWNGAESGLGVVMLNAMFGLQITRLWASVFIACLLSSLAYAYVCVLEKLSGAQDRPIMHTPT